MPHIYFSLLRPYNNRVTVLVEAENTLASPIRVLGHLSAVGLEALSLGVVWQARKLEETKLVGPNAFYRPREA